MVVYIAEEESHCCQDIGTYTAWGIQARQISEGSQIMVTYVQDVFLCKSVADDFAALCTRLDLDPCHLNDVVEDYLVTI